MLLFTRTYYCVNKDDNLNNQWKCVGPFTTYENADVLGKVFFRHIHYKHSVLIPISVFWTPLFSNHILKYKLEKFFLRYNVSTYTYNKDIKVDE